MTRFASEFGAYEIDSLPSQVQVAIAHGFFIAPTHRGQGKASELKADQNARIAALGYDYAIATVVADNVRQKRTLERAGWRKFDQFFSKRQDTTVEIWRYIP